MTYNDQCRTRTRKTTERFMSTRLSLYIDA